MRKNKNLTVTIIPILAVIMMTALVTASPATAVNLPTAVNRGEGVKKAQGTVQDVNYDNRTLRLNNQTYVFDEDNAVVFLRGMDVAAADVVVIFYKEDETVVDGKPTIINKGLRLMVYARGAAAKDKVEEDDKGVSRPVDIVY